MKRMTILILLQAVTLFVLGVVIAGDMGVQGLLGYIAGYWVAIAWVWVIKEAT